MIYMICILSGATTFVPYCGMEFFILPIILFLNGESAFEFWIAFQDSDTAAKNEVGTYSLEEPPSFYVCMS